MKIKTKAELRSMMLDAAAKPPTAYLVLQWQFPYTPEQRIEVVGVFSTREKATAACRTRDYHCIECPVDEAAPHEPVKQWPHFNPVYEQELAAVEPQ